MLKKFLISTLVICIILSNAITHTTNVSAGTQTAYYVSPLGNDSNPGTESQPLLTLQKARDVVRTKNSNMTGDIYVYLRGGTYTLAGTLELNQNDSGTNGYNVIYKNYPGEIPIISGGETVTGWTLYDSQKNIYRASVDATLETRQIYVNGVRAIRARSAGGLPGARIMSTGYTTTDSNMQNWENKSDIEFVYDYKWVQIRCGVSGITGTTITMKQPGWDMSSNKVGVSLKVDCPNPTYMENAYELLDAEGEWYLDRTADKLYYKPRTGENMDTAAVIAAKLETLVNGTGTLSNPIHNIQFEGITFSYATWLNPNGNEGFAQIQADACSKPYATKEYGWDLDNWVMMPSNIKFTTAKNIRFERNKFIHLGATALGFKAGSQNNIISGNEFTDISGSGVQIGGIGWNDSYPADARYIVKNNEVTNNYIHNIAAEYKGCTGIFAGYAENTKIAHNEICDLPYSAISIGWGWGGRDFADIPFIAEKNEDISKIENNTPSTSKNNKIMNNHIYKIMNYLKDGGGIYSLGAQPGEVIEGNYIHEDNNEYGALYLDNGSRYVTVSNNILHSNTSNFIVAGAGTSADNDMEYNYWDIYKGYWDAQTPNMIGNNFFISDSVPSHILDNVGLEAAYRNLLPQHTVNIALGKTASAYYADGSPAVMHNGCEANKAVDGNLSTIAQAKNQYVWMEQVDLGKVYSISRVKTSFGTGAYATQYDIQVSTSGGSFTTIKSVTGCTGGVSEQTFAPVNARFVRIKAVKPDGPSQTGGQMSIAELNVYGTTSAPSSYISSLPSIVPNYNIASGRKASAYYIDGSPALMQSGCEANKAVDGNPATIAQAINQYAWILEIDLGHVHNINRVKTTFGAGAYATEYDIQVSTEGESFTTVKSVTGCMGGVSEQAFTPANARYVRIKAVKPDGPNQTGGQMSIAELDVYGYNNIAYKKLASSYYNDGSPAMMQTGCEAAKGVDGTTTTFAQAMNQYPWIYQVDLGAVYDVNKIIVSFHKNAWATDFEIQGSTTGDSYSVLQRVTGFGVTTEDRSYLLNINPYSTVRYLRIKAIKPDGPGQTGAQMCISEVQVGAVIEQAIKLSEMTDNSVTGDKCYYRTISNMGFTFQPGDVISYDVKLCTNDIYIGGIDIKNTDGTVFRTEAWYDQNGITGTPFCDLRSAAYGKWYHREMTIPNAMAGKTASAWMLAFENDSVSTTLQAIYSNIVVKRSGSTVLTVYKNGSPAVNTLEYSNLYDTEAPACVVNRN